MISLSDFADVVQTLAHALVILGALIVTGFAFFVVFVVMILFPFLCWIWNRLISIC
jgi:hypothetical protein